MGWLSSGCYVWGGCMTNYLILGLLVALIYAIFFARRKIRMLQLDVAILKAQKIMAENGAGVQPDKPWPRK